MDPNAAHLHQEQSNDLDPFDFTGKEYKEAMTGHQPHASWDGSYNWKPVLKAIPRGKDRHPKLRGRPSDIAQAILHHMGEPMRLNNHPFMIPIYNNGDESIVLKCSRQVAKSTTIACIQTTESVVIKHWHSLYVSPSTLQTRQYSNEKLRPSIYESPFIHKHFIDKTVIDQVFEKTLNNRSYMFLRYAFLSPARARGIPASRVFFDEAQDLLKDNIKIISQSLSASRLHGQAGRTLIAGTPLTFSNTLEEYWKYSSQNEWLVPCTRHSPTYWNLLDSSNIGKKGLICSKAGCGELINPATGQWVSFNPTEQDVGYHITQLMVPWKQSVDAWHKDIVVPFERWPEAKFNNEILGLAYDSASAPITQMEIQRCCYPTKTVGTTNTEHLLQAPTAITRSMRVFAGIDYGEGRPEGEVIGGKKKFASWTVLTLGGYIGHDIFWPFFMKRYAGKEIDPDFIIQDLLTIAGQFNVEVVGADWGHGWGLNSRLFKARGSNRVMQFAYSHSLGERKKWDPDGYKFIINRNAVISGVFEDIKREKMIFPVWEELQPFGRDYLAEYVEYNDITGTMKYDHPIDQPDDALHSLIYCKLAADIQLGKF